jgi:uncharacterized membrane protein
MNAAVIVVSVVGWVLIAVGLLIRPKLLRDIWQRFRAMAFQIALWLVLFPWIVSLVDQ